MDVLEIMESSAIRLVRGEWYMTAHELDQSRAAVAELIEAANMMRTTLQMHGEWDDGCFYYGGMAASELQGPISSLSAAISRVRGE